MSNTGEFVRFDGYSGLALNTYSIHRTYGVSLRMEQEGKETQHLSYEILVEGKNVNGNAWLLEIHKTNVRLNHQRPHQLADELAYQCGQVYYPLQLKVDNDWQGKTAIYHEALMERWEKVKKEIKNKYNNEIVDWYLRETEKNIMHPVWFSRAVDQDLFFAFFFAPLYKTYHSSLNTAPAEMRIPLVPHTRPVDYQAEQKVSGNYTSYDTVTVIQNGKVSDERSDYDLVTRKDIPVSGTTDASHEKGRGTLRATYELDKDTRLIQSILADCDIQLPYGESRSIHLEAYHLEERDREWKNENTIKQPIDEQTG